MLSSVALYSLVYFFETEPLTVALGDFKFWHQIQRDHPASASVSGLVAVKTCRHAWLGFIELMLEFCFPP